MRRTTAVRVPYGGGGYALTGAGAASVNLPSSSRLIFRSTKNAAVGIVPASSTHTCLRMGHLALEPRSKAKTR